jgi:hypothetical protein
MFLGWKKVKRRVVRNVKRVNRSYELHKEAARTLLHDRLEHFNRYYGQIYNRVAIRDQRRCWGSCSSKGNLNFSYKLLFLPPCLRDYIVVHELCHLRVLNHSADFWMVVAEVMPDYAERAATLRTLERTHGTALATLKKLPSHDATACAFCVRDTERVDAAAVYQPGIPSHMKDYAVDDVLVEVRHI